MARKVTKSKAKVSISAYPGILMAVAVFCGIALMGSFWLMMAVGIIGLNSAGTVKCVDNDGLDYNTPSYTQVQYLSRAGKVFAKYNYYDTKIGSSLREMTCNGYKVGNKTVNCAGGFTSQKVNGKTAWACVGSGSTVGSACSKEDIDKNGQVDAIDVQLTINASLGILPKDEKQSVGLKELDAAYGTDNATDGVLGAVEWQKVMNCSLGL